MKLLIDENLSDRLVSRLKDLFPDSKHVKHVGLAARVDSDLWDLARKDGYIILTQDDDFVELSMLRGAPPKVVHLAMGNHTTHEWLEIIRANLSAIEQFVADEDTGLLVIR